MAVHHSQEREQSSFRAVWGQHPASAAFEQYGVDLQDIDFIVAKAARESEPDRRAESHLLHRAIAELGERYREPLMMQVFGGYTGKEIAARLKLNGNTVMTRLFRARAQLSRKLELGS